MIDVIKALGFEALPTAIIVLLFGLVVKFSKKDFRNFAGRFDTLDKKLDVKFDGIDKSINKLTVGLEENNRITDACKNTSKLLLLEKMRFFVTQNERTPDKDAYFQKLYADFENLGNGDDWGLLKIWNEKPLKI